MVSRPSVAARHETIAPCAAAQPGATARRDVHVADHQRLQRIQHHGALPGLDRRGAVVTADDVRSYSSNIFSSNYTLKVSLRPC